MIIKMTNKDEKFYEYMGRLFFFFLVEKQTNDRIYDDVIKEWYIYLEEDKVVAFVSISKNVIKNIYTTKEKYLEEILNQIKEENHITYSIITKSYAEIYEKCGFKISKNQDYKNFVLVYTEEKK